MGVFTALLNMKMFYSTTQKEAAVLQPLILKNILFTSY